MSFTTFCLAVLALVLTPAQRVWALVAVDGVQPRDLPDEDREMCRLIFGDIEEVPARARRVLLAIWGRNSGKDQVLAAAYGLWRMLTAVLAGVGLGDEPVFICIAPDTKTAGISKKRAHSQALAVPTIAQLLVSETADGFALRRPDGKIVRFEVLAASRGGSAVRGRSVLGALMNECAFFRDPDSGVVNDAEIFGAIIPRLMKGGAVVLASTPWAEVGLLWDLYSKNYERPVSALVSQASTLVMRDNDPDVAEMVAAEEARDPLNAARETGAQFISTGSSLMFDPALIDGAVDKTMAHPFAYNSTARKASCGDLAFRSDSAALVILQAKGASSWLALAEELRPQKGAPLVPGKVMGHFVRLMGGYESRQFMCDGHYIESAREHGAPYGVQVFEAPSGQSGKLTTHLAAKELLSSRAFRMPDIPRLVAQMKAIKSKPLAGGGLQISSPRSARGGHGDIASSLVLGLWAIRASELGRSAREARAASDLRLHAQLALVGGPAFAPFARDAIDNLVGLEMSEPKRRQVLEALAGGTTLDDAFMSPRHRIALAQAKIREANIAAGRPPSGLSERDAAALNERLQKGDPDVW